MVHYNDNTLLPEGKWKGKKLKDVPPHDLLMIHAYGTKNEQLKKYIESNLEDLRLRARLNTKMIRR